LTLLPSDNQTGLYTCAVREDGVYTVLHAFILILHAVKIEHFAEEVEVMGLEIFLIFVPIMLIACIAAAVVNRLRSLRKEKMQIVKKTLEDEFQNSMSKLPLVESSGQDGPADKDPNELTDELDTTRQTDDLETTGVTDDLDTTGRTDDLETTGKTDEIDTTGPIDDEDMDDDDYEKLIIPESQLKKKSSTQNS
ncbi:hypothetical protein AM593_02885, partial [Mytilus galloprovincialis]